MVSALASGVEPRSAADEEIKPPENDSVGATLDITNPCKLDSWSITGEGILEARFMSVTFEEAAGTHGAESMSVDTFVDTASMSHVPSRATYGASGSRIERSLANVLRVYTPPALCVTMLTCLRLTLWSSAGTVSSQACILISSDTGVEPPIPGLHYELER